ncbi:MAG: hypothetical protein Kow0056_08190 [Coriobacteriia bacterium]
MIEALPRRVADIRPYFDTEHRDMLKVLLNSTSAAEANLALQVLEEAVPAKALVTACNLREAIKEIPRCPISMAVDFEQLARIWELARVDNCWERDFEDARGDYTIILIGEGNTCYDLAIRSEEGTALWLALDPEEDLISQRAIELVMSRETLLRNVAELVQAMGLPFNPSFYLSLEDWRLEYAASMFEEFNDLLPKLAPRDERRPTRRGPLFHPREWLDL